MQIFEYEDTLRQSLLCLNYDFTEDCQSDREVVCHRFGRGIDAKRYWSYGQHFKGLHVLLALEGSTPVGQIEIIPIEHAPQPVDGEGLMFVDCLYVAPQARRRGVGSRLLQAAEEKAHEQAKKGLALIAYPGTTRMPVSFFVERDFLPVAEDDGRYLMTKTWADVRPPEFMRRCLPSAETRERGKVVVDYFWSGQCPYAVRLRDRLLAISREMDHRLVLREVNTDDRTALEQFGIAQGCYLNGRHAFTDPPSEAQIRRALEEALQAA